LFGNLDKEEPTTFWTFVVEPSVPSTPPASRFSAGPHRAEHISVINLSSSSFFNISAIRREHLDRAQEPSGTGEEARRYRRRYRYSTAAISNWLFEIQLVVEESGQLKLNLRAENAFLQCPVFATAAKDKSKRRPSQIRGALFALAGISSGGFESFKFRCA
jgi:hypothetical protein